MAALRPPAGPMWNATRIHLKRTGTPQGGDMIDLWYKNAVIYSLDVETFYDSNGDGVGDFQGLMSKLDYLAALNVTCLWLLPFYPSPNRDNGYDVLDFYGVDQRLGTLGDFVECMRQARERGIRILVDLVVNHTSVDHPWFQEARRDPRSPYREYYVWSEEKPADADEGMIFPGQQESTWTYDEQAGAWYFHRFYAHQPDLNVANPHVRDEISKIMSFWLQLGVSGFRVDALPFLIELRGIDAGDQDPHEFLREFRTYLSWRQGDAVMLAEANVSPDEVPAYLGDGDKVHVMFNFFANQHLFLALACEDAGALRAAYEALPPIPRVCQWANFLRTHDELDLGRLSDRERQDVFAAFAPEPRMQLYERGIRRRLAPMLDNDRRRIELVHSLMLTLPGTPVMRYGDEIGMGDDLSLDDREAVRTPMQWNHDANGGFSPAPPGQIIRPVISGGTYGYEEVNVAAQQQDEQSLLTWMQRVLRTRRECPEFGWGAWTFLDTGSRHVLAHRCQFRDHSVLVVHNFSGEPQSVELELRSGCTARDLLTRAAPEVEGRLRLDLNSYEYHWYREAAPRAEGPRPDTAGDPIG